MQIKENSNTCSVNHDKTEECLIHGKAPDYTVFQIDWLLVFGVRTSEV